MIDRQLEGEKYHPRFLDMGCGSVKIGIGVLALGGALHGICYRLIGVSEE